MFLCTQRKFGKFGTAVVHFDPLYAYTHIYTFPYNQIPEQKRRRGFNCLKHTTDTKRRQTN